MVKADYIYFLEKPIEIKNQQTTDLKLIVNKFPYFQSARALYLKGLKKQDSFKYNNELKVTAAHTSDRAILFDFITSDAFHKTVEKKNIHQQIAVKKSNETLTEVSNNLNIGKPLDFKQSETLSFNQWLQLSVKKPIVRASEKKKAPIDTKATIINQFIQNNPKITPVHKNKNIVVSLSENTNNSSLMTETLAKVYLEQKKYGNAIQAYRILSLKYPEKSGFFADQIKRIQILQKSKS